MVEDIPSGSKHLVRLLQKLHSGDSMETLKVTRKHLTQPGAMDRIVRTVQQLHHRPQAPLTRSPTARTHTQLAAWGKGNRGMEEVVMTASGVPEWTGNVIGYASEPSTTLRQLLRAARSQPALTSLTYASPPAPLHPATSRSHPPTLVAHTALLTMGSPMTWREYWSKASQTLVVVGQVARARRASWRSSACVATSSVHQGHRRCGRALLMHCPP